MVSIFPGGFESGSHPRGVGFGIYHPGFFRERNLCMDYIRRSGLGRLGNIFFVTSGQRHADCGDGGQGME